MVKRIFWFLIFILILGLAGLNIYQYIGLKSRLSNEMYVSYNKFYYTEKNYWDYLENNGLKDFYAELETYIIQEQLSMYTVSANEVTNIYIKELYNTYGDDLEEQIIYNTSFSSLDDYKNSLFTYNLVLSKIKSVCIEKKYSDEECEDNFARLENEFLYDLLSSKKINFGKDKVREGWSNYVERYKKNSNKEKPLLEVKYSSLREVNYEELKTMIEEKDFLVVSIISDDNNQSESFLSKLDSLLYKLNISGYYINKDKLSEDEINEMPDLLDVSVTPITYIIKNRVVGEEILIGNQHLDTIKTFLQQNQIIE